MRIYIMFLYETRSRFCDGKPQIYSCYFIFIKKRVLISAKNMSRSLVGLSFYLIFNTFICAANKKTDYPNSKSNLFDVIFMYFDVRMMLK